MRYDITDAGKKKIEAIVVTHNGEEIVFRGPAGVNGGNTTDELFQFLNEYFQGCPKDKLDRLFGLLKDAKRILEPGYFDDVETEEIAEARSHESDYVYLTERLQTIIKKMYEICTPQEIAYAAHVTGRTAAPKDLMVMASMGDYPEETTINNEKYSELVKLALATQLCIPIINQLLGQVNEVTGRDYQYAVAGSMLNYIQYLKDMPGWRILDTYIRASCARQEARRNTMEVVSDARYQDHIIYRGLFSKLAMSFIPSLVRDKNLSKELNSLVEGEIRKEQAVKFTGFDQQKPGADDQSIPEAYRVREVVNSSEEIQAGEYFSFGLFDHRDQPRHTDIFASQCLGLGIEAVKTVEKVYNTLPTVWDFRLTNLHLQLLQLVYIDTVPPNLFPALNYIQLRAAIALGQVRLYEMGYDNLAPILGMVRVDSGSLHYMTDEYKLNTRERDDLVALCYLRKGQGTASTDNMMVIAAQDFLDELAAGSWESNIEPGLLGDQRFVDKMSPGDMYEVGITQDVKKEFLALIKQLHSIEAE